MSKRMSMLFFFYYYFLIESVMVVCAYVVFVFRLSRLFVLKLLPTDSSKQEVSTKPRHRPLKLGCHHSSSFSFCLLERASVFPVSSDVFQCLSELKYEGLDSLR